MKAQLIIVRYSEIGLKGKATRKIFVNKLIENIKKALNLEGIDFSISKTWSRIYISTKEIKKTSKVLEKIFGIYSFSPAFKTESNLKSISKLAISLARENLDENTSFAIRATRSGKHNFSSQDVAIKTGEKIVNNTTSKVNLTIPDLELFIDIREKFTYIFTEKKPGIGGLPYNTQGKVLTLFNDDKSLLASWFLIRRGCNSILIGGKKVSETDLRSFNEKWHIKCKYFELKLTENFFEKINTVIKDENCFAMVTDHSVYDNYDVIKDLKIIKEKINVPVLTPLILMDKKSIHNKSSEIGLKI